MRHSILVLLTLVASCYGGPPEGVYPCHPMTVATDCPHAWVCRADSTCWSTPGDAAVSADAGDAGVTPHDANIDTNCVPSTEVCDGRDNDCDGMPDDGFPCVQGAASTCTTSCGSTGTGVCSATCALPTGTTCSPPTTESVCDGRDDDCNGVADEGLLTLVQANGGLGFGTTGVQLLGAASGYLFFGTTPSGFQLVLLGSDGTPGTAVTLDSRIAPTIGYSVAAAANDALIGYGGMTLARVNTTGGLSMYGAVPSASLPTGYTAGSRVVIASSDGGTATVYASLVSVATPTTYAVTRLQANVSGTLPSAPVGALLAMSLSGDQVFDVLSTASGDVLVFRDTSGMLQVVSSGATIGMIDATARTTTGTTTATTGPVSVAIAIADAASAIGPTNPLAVAWLDSGANSATRVVNAHFVEVRGSAPFSVSTPLTLATTQPSIASGSVGGNLVDIAAFPNGSPGDHSGHWLLAATPNAALGVFEVLGGHAAPTANAIVNNVVASYGVTIVDGSFGLRIASAGYMGNGTTGYGCP